MKHSPQAGMSIIQTLTRSFSVWKSSFADIWLLSLIVNIILTLPYFIHPHGYTYKIYESMLQYQFSYFWILFFVQFFMIAIIYGAMYQHIIATITGQTETFVSALKVAIKRSPSVVIASFIFMACVLIGTAFLVFPGIYLFVALYFTMPIIFFEEIGPIAALLHGGYLVTAYWWRSAIIVIVSMAVMILVTVACLSLTHDITIAHHSGFPYRVGDVLAIGIIGFILTPWMFSLYVVHVFDLEKRNLEAHPQESVVSDSPEDTPVTG